MTDKRKLTDVLKELGESSSLHGIPKIISSRQIVIKLLWCILLIGAVALSSYQIHQLFSEYNSYPVKTVITLKYNKLPFPAITICNNNPIKITQLVKHDELRELLFNKFEENDNEKDPWKHALVFYDDLTESGDDATSMVTSDAFEDWRTQVLSTYRNVSDKDRRTMGHQFEDMVHKFSFRGFQYFLDKIRTKYVYSPLYGNCYVFDLPGFAETSGPEKGFRIILNLEKDEYVEHLVSGYGMRLSIHERGTLALPEKDSIVLNPGYETNIGLKMVKVERLGGNYGHCYAGEGTASIPVCHADCTAYHVFARCGCIPYDSPFHWKDEPVCSNNDTQVETCITDTKEAIYEGHLQCNCLLSCEEHLYSRSISSRNWPNQNYLEKVLMKTACVKNMTSMETICERLKSEGTIGSQNYEAYATNFLAVNIYFEDLNFETISEEPLYNTVRFLSDLGGAMGFYMGASLLTYVEIIQLIIEISLHMKNKYWTKKMSRPPGCISEKVTRVTPIYTSN